MNILINASNLKVGGGLQVANTIIGGLNKFAQHNFVVVVSNKVQLPPWSMLDFPFIQIVEYNKNGSILNAFLGRDSFLDKLVEKHHIERVFTIFGPSYWRPKVKHICGFAYPHYLYKDSPFWNIISWKQKVRFLIVLPLIKYAFQHTVDYFVTENKDVTEGVKKIFKTNNVFTVTNFYNSVFDDPNLWDRSIKLPVFDGITLLTIASNYPHKNLAIIKDVCKCLKIRYPSFKFRFVLTIDKSAFPEINKCTEVLVLGKVDISQCPFLYEQSDIMFLPTLLECFSASYPEAMRMGKPIMTSSIGFAKGLCGKAAIYFDALNAKEIADKIYRLSMDSTLKERLIIEEIKQLAEYDNNIQRLEKYMQIIESI